MQFSLDENCRPRVTEKTAGEGVYECFDNPSFSQTSQYMYILDTEIFHLYVWDGCIDVPLATYCRASIVFEEHVNH